MGPQSSAWYESLHTIINPFSMNVSLISISIAFLLLLFVYTNDQDWPAVISAEVHTCVPAAMYHGTARLDPHSSDSRLFS